MIFTEDKEKGFHDCPFNSNFLIWKNSSQFTWELCLKHVNNPDGYPQIIGRIVIGGVPGSLSQTSNLAWSIDEEYRGQGFMSQLLEMYVQEVVPDVNGFAVVIMKDNVASVRLAQKVGFEIYEEKEAVYYLNRRA